MSLDATYSVSVRNLCEFAAKTGDLDLRFKPTPTAKEGREGHQLVASRRTAGHADHEAEVSLCGSYQELRIRGRADGYDPTSNVLEEVKTFRGRVEAIAPNHSELHWAQLKVYGWLMCQDRALQRITLALVYFDVMEQTEHPIQQEFAAKVYATFPQ
jgi:DNA excision repair protein ERCC-2